jgi:2-dehydropantoate 2-reductase
VETPSGVITAQPKVLTDPSHAQPVDWVLVATKAYQAQGTAAWFGGLCAKGAPVAVLQNGVEHRERFIPYLPEERIVPVIVECPAERDGPAKIRQRRRAALLVPEGALGKEFAGLFGGTEIDLALTADFKSAAWKKLCFNSAGIVSALLLEPAGVMRDEQIGEAARQIIRECLAVARAEGAVLPDTLVEEVLQRYRASPPDSVNSIHADRLEGRPMEIDARNGVIVRLGRKHGIATPGNQMAVALLEAMSRPPPK